MNEAFAHAARARIDQINAEAAAADELLDEFLTTHGPFRGMGEQE